MMADTEMLWQGSGLAAARGIATAVLLSSVLWVGLGITLFVIW